jgi:tyrosine phenol-lyase
MLFPSTRAHIEMNGAKVIDVIGNDAHDLQSSAPFKGNLDLAKLEGAIREHGADKVSCIYVELAVNACGGHPVALGNLKAVKAVATAHKIPLYLDACRVLENSYLIKEREAGYQDRTILDIVRDTSALADACTMSALKDLLVPSGGLILMRDVVDYQKSLLQSFLDGAQLSGAGMEQMAIALKEIFASDAYLESRVEQVRYLWQRLVDEGLPVLRPSAGHAVYIDVKSFLPHLGPGQFPAEALAAFLYQRSGIRVTKGPPAAPSQAGRGVELLRLAVPARKYLNGHLDDVARALLNAHRQRNQIKGLNRIEDPSRSKYQPAQFEPL